MGLILDSSTLIAAEKGKFALQTFLATRDEPVVIAAITASELLHEAHRAADARRKQRRLDYVEWVLTKFGTIPFALDEARHHARVWADLASRGQIIGGNDLLIAATALSLGFTLATFNRGEFARVLGLDLVAESVLAPFRTG